MPSVAFLWFSNIKLYLWIKMRYKGNMTILEQVYIFRLAFFLIEHRVQLEIIVTVGGKAYFVCCAYQ